VAFRRISRTVASVSIDFRQLKVSSVARSISIPVETSIPGHRTTAALNEIDVDYVVPLHCSGEVFYDIAKAEMPHKLLRSYTGTRFVFGDTSS